MSSVLDARPGQPAGQGGAGGDALAERLRFSQGLQAVTNKIHAATELDEIILELSQEVCTLFEADRLTIYVSTEDGNSIVSKVKTGLNSFKDLKLPINEQSIAGYVATTRRVVNIEDVYNDDELKRYSPQLHFLKEVDKRTGYRTRQMLVVPVCEPVKETQRRLGGEAARPALVGVIQVINSKTGHAFSQTAEDGARHFAETLAIALLQRQKQPALKVRGKYDQLVAGAVLSADEMELALRSARRKSIDIEDVLLDEFQVKVALLGDSLAQFFQCPYEPFRADRLKPVDLLKNIRREFAAESGWLPLEEGKDGLVVLCVDPEKVRGSRQVGNVFPKTRVDYRVTTRREFTATMNQLFGGGNEPMLDATSVGDLLSELSDDAEDDGSTAAELSAASENEVVRLVNKIIIDAYHQGASDIHVEPGPGKQKTLVRFRKDGSLHPYIEVPSSYRQAIAARLKIMCDLDISEKRRPQDGKIKFRKFGPLDIELRVATIPSQGGVEDIVMRILAAGEPIPLDKLGVSDHNLAMLKSVITKPYGLFFVCGPTGSGKTTSLHSVLGYINTPETKIWTAEDPVEITQRGLRQVQMNPKAGLTFATAMKAFLRADPDVIMVGEMRDKETVAIGIEASLTGHLVFATLHTNSAPESITRLLDMGMDPFNFADALLGILAQRLAKRLCSKCRKPHVASAEEIERLLDEYVLELKQTDTWQKDPQGARAQLRQAWVRQFGNAGGEITLYSKVGCDTCSGTGYKGRTGLHELLLGTDRLKKAIQAHARVSELFAIALEEGMRTLKMDGIEKVLLGITDIQQVRAVCIK
jgi:type II secretory ATPase GspE/PulE/Tfp pilus assembly ATPase PilB-like protein/GAF domain-containing protein